MKFARMAIAICMVPILTGVYFPSGVWSGYRYPQASDWRTTGTMAPCPSIGVQNLSRSETATILEAALAVCETMADPRLVDRIMAEPEWLADCTSGGMPRMAVSAEQVVQALVPPRTSFSVVARRPRGAVAVTNLRYMGIAIRKQRFTAWQSGDPARQAEMIETLAHEMTHLIPEAPGRRVSRFKDENHVASERDPARCLNSKLVSYDVGRIVSELWLHRLSERPATNP